MVLTLVVVAIDCFLTKAQSLWNPDHGKWSMGTQRYKVERRSKIEHQVVTLAKWNVGKWQVQAGFGSWLAPLAVCSGERDSCKVV